MAFPEDDYTCGAIVYSVTASNGISILIQANSTLNSGMETFLTYLETALANMKASYESGESPSHMWVNKTYTGYQDEEILPY